MRRRATRMEIVERGEQELVGSFPSTALRDSSYQCRMSPSRSALSGGSSGVPAMHMTGGYWPRCVMFEASDGHESGPVSLPGAAARRRFGAERAGERRERLRLDA